MNDEEKAQYPVSKTAGGYVKDTPYKEAFTKSMQNTSKEEIEHIKKLPNFNKKVFEDISGFKIKVEQVGFWESIIRFIIGLV